MMDESIRDLDLTGLNKDELDEPEIIERDDLSGELPILGGTRDTPVLRSGSVDGVTFLGYLDEPEEMLPGGKRRCLFGCNSPDDVAYLPKTEGFTLPNGGKTAAPAPWSIGLVRGGSSQVLGTDVAWGDL